MGFIATPKLVRPKSLLNGNVVDPAQSAPIKLALVKARSEEKYSSIEIGSIDDIADNLTMIREYLSESLIAQAEAILQQRSETNDA